MAQGPMHSKTAQSGPDPNTQQIKFKTDKDSRVRRPKDGGTSR